MKLFRTLNQENAEAYNESDQHRNGNLITPNLTMTCATMYLMPLVGSIESNPIQGDQNGSRSNSHKYAAVPKRKPKHQSAYCAAREKRVEKMTIVVHRG